MDQAKPNGRGWYRIPMEVRTAILGEYAAGANICQVAEAHGVTWLAVRNILKKAGVEIRGLGKARKRSDKLAASGREDIVRDYVSGADSTDLSRKYGVTQTHVSRIVKAAGVTRSNREAHRTHTLNEFAFDEVTEASAYWIGFLMADGCVVESKDGKQAPELALGLSAKDKIHVEKFRAFLGSDHKVIESESTTSYGVRFPSARLHVRSFKLTSVLATYGVVPKKSERATVIGLEGDRHFWRGVVDGDGCITRSGRYSCVILVGSRNLMEQFLSFVKNLFPECRSTVRPDGRIFRVALGSAATFAVLCHLYGDCSVYLDRKMAKAKEVIGDL